MSDESKGMFLGLVGVVSFGLTLPATRFIIPYFEPVFIGLGRAVIASFVAAFLLIATKQTRPSKNQFYQLLVVASGVVVGFPILSAWAMQTVPASHGGVVLGVLPLATAIVGAVVSNEKPSVAFWICGIVGGAVVIAYSLLQGVGEFQTGDFFFTGCNRECCNWLCSRRKALKRNRWLAGNLLGPGNIIPFYYCSSLAGGATRRSW